jgi:D-alanine-D-alanine ligase
MMEALLKRIPEDLKSMPIAVIMGGESIEKDFSLRSGKNIEKALVCLGLKAIPLQYDSSLQSALEKNDIQICLLATHGVPGEDGKLQGYLDHIGLCYSGASVAGSALAMNKLASKSLLKSAGYQTPSFRWINPKGPSEKTAHELATELKFPMVLKPTFGGSSIGIRLVHDLIELRTSLEELSDQYDDLFAETFVSGREFTVSVLEDSKGRAYALPVMELRSANLFYDYEAKWSGQSMDCLVPARLEESLQKQLTEQALEIHQRLMQRDHSRSDFMLSESGELNYLETNSIPGLTENSDLPAQARAAGLTFEEVVLSILMGPYRRLKRA